MSSIVVSEVESNILRVGEVRVSDTCWLLDVEDVGFPIPAIRVLAREVLVSISPSKRSVLLHEAEHRGATWSTIVPEEEWVVFGVILTLYE